MKKRSGLWVHGAFSGWAEYRHAKPVTVPGEKPKPIFKGEARNALIRRAQSVLDHYFLSPFESEGAVRAGLRSRLCLEGYGWHHSDQEASTIAIEALRRNGAVRPTWEAGQPEYTDSPDLCSWCRGPLDIETRTRSQRFCSADCARMAIQHRDAKSGAYAGAVLRSAQRLIDKDRRETRECEYCAKPFKSDRSDARFCSPRCVSRAQKGEALIPPTTCEWCGKWFQPKGGRHTCCSLTCRSLNMHRKQREALAQEVRQCGCCGTDFTPTTAKAMYCSPRCSSTMANRSYRQRNASTGFQVRCQWCETAFTAKTPWAKFCSDDCTREAKRVTKPGRRPKPITARVFDFLFREAA